MVHEIYRRYRSVSEVLPKANCKCDGLFRKVKKILNDEILYFDCMWTMCRLRPEGGNGRYIEGCCSERSKGHRMEMSKQMI